jgi:NAD(P)-dependent dehydrogenase (short-subunit alcohol dehydrogenase family)
MIDRLTGNDKEAIEQFTNLEPVARFGQAEEIADAVLWMCSRSFIWPTGLWLLTGICVIIHSIIL